MSAGGHFGVGAEVSDLRADPSARARGAILDVSSDAKSGLTVDGVISGARSERATSSSAATGTARFERGGGTP